MRILFITRKWPPAMGGMETYSVELVREFRTAHEVDLYALSGMPNGDAPGANAIARFGLATSWKLLSRSNRSELIYGGDMAIWPLAALASIRNRNARVALSAHGTDVSFAFRGGALPTFYKAYMKLGSLILSTAKVIANSQATASLARELGFERISVVPLATKLSTEFSTKGPQPFILFAGRLIRRKGLAWFVKDVLPQLPQELELQVAGTIWEETEGAALKDPRVKFLGPLPQDELAEKMAMAVCVVAPNIPVGEGHIEGFGLIAAEAAAAGGVVLASDLDGFKSSVLDGVTGRLLPPKDPDQWITAITEIVNWSPERRHKVVRRARKAAIEHFNWARVANDTIASID